MTRRKLVVTNPKKNGGGETVDSFWYNYYAGYSHSFTSSLLKSACLKKNAVVLDPWNGAGTTTYVASLLGIRSVGIDLNPVMKVVAKAKFATLADLERIERQITQINFSGRAKSYENDPLSLWFNESSVVLIRKLERRICTNAVFQNTCAKIDALTAEQCLLYTILFILLREYLVDFVPSNPTWIKTASTALPKVDLELGKFKERLRIVTNRMIENIRTSNTFPKTSDSDLIIGTSEALQLKNESIDLVLTSPPYCTRIDYGVATQPELALLAVGGRKEIDLIRRSLMGTTTVPPVLGVETENFGKICEDFLEQVKRHSSKASSTYYFKNFAQYFLSMKKSIEEVARVMKSNSYFICVVQDSFYKNIHCDLPSIVVEMAEKSQIKLVERVSFQSKQNMGNMNRRSKVYRKQITAIEEVLVLRKYTDYDK